MAAAPATPAAVRDGRGAGGAPLPKGSGHDAVARTRGRTGGREILTPRQRPRCRRGGGEVAAAAAATPAAARGGRGVGGAPLPKGSGHYTAVRTRCETGGPSDANAAAAAAALPRGGVAVAAAPATPAAAVGYTQPL